MDWKFTPKTTAAAVFFLLINIFCATAQTGVLSPTDTVVIYNPSAPPATPPSGTLADWVKTNRLSWSTTSFKTYVYNGLQFRLKFPKNFSTATDGKTYPLFVFFHGVGEKGTIYDNEYQLYLGGQTHMNAVDAGKFDGFLMYPQSSSTSGGWSQAQIDLVYNLIMNYFVPQIKVDINRIIVSGLSGGGSGAWNMIQSHPTLAAAAVIMSSASISDKAYASSLAYTPIWLAQGGLDPSPAPATTAQLVAAFNSAGANLSYYLYSTVGHKTWDSTWLEPGYLPFLNRAHKANPWVIGGRYGYCPSDAIDATLGVTAGFDGYQWRKDGAVIAGATANTIHVTATGVYDCRILRGSTWSPWSPIPDTIYIKGATVAPTITVKGIASSVLPATDGSTSVSLMVPAGYASYTWARADSNAILSSKTNVLTGATPGSYKVLVTEKFGCSSSYSTPFVVLNANGAKGPSVPINPLAGAVSQTAVKVTWTEDPSPAYKETQFEIYQAMASDGPYTLLGFSNALADSFTATGLNPKTTYYYRIRAINANAASAASAPVSATTLADTIAPTAPGNLRIGTVSKTSVQLLWDSATDNAAVTYYDIYINGVKSYTQTSALDSITIYNLTENQLYAFAVKARDFAGNASPFSNQVVVKPGFSGLVYSYYEGSWNKLPDFNTLTPIKTGTISNVSLSPAESSTYYTMTWKGYINIPVTGTYYFQTISDDGSKVYVDTAYAYGATPVVNSDIGKNTGTTTGPAVYLTAGPHLFTATYIQAVGGATMTVNWKMPGSTVFSAIPDSAFVENRSSGLAGPAAPSGLKATAAAYNRVNLSWTNNDTALTATEVYRAASASGPWVTVGRGVGKATSFTDSTVSAATTYYYRVRAINNTGTSKYNGSDSTTLTWRYYTGTWQTVPDFSSLTPVASDTTTTVSVNSIPNRGTYWGATFKGYINIPVNGKYVLYTVSDDGSMMYIDGNLVVNNDGGHSLTVKSGTVQLTAGMHAFEVDYIQIASGQSLSVSYSGPTIATQPIPSSAYVKAPVSVTTGALPGVPSMPGAFAVTSASTRKVYISWRDSVTRASSYNLYRSAGTSGNFTLLSNVPAANGSTVVVDTTVYPNTTYYYKLNALNVGGSSPFTATLSVTTGDSLPVVAAIANQTMRWSTTATVNVTATSPVNDQLSLVFTGLPAFATVTSTGNGTATLSFSPGQSQQGTYSITVTATDQHGGASSKGFTLTVNSIYNPVISGVSDISVAEGATGSLVLTAADQNPGDSVRWRFSGLPFFVTPVIAGSTVTLKIAPGYSDQGSYTAAAIAYGGVGGLDSQRFVITVSDVNPNRTVFVAFNNGSKLAAAPWNNTAKATPTLNDVFGPFKDSTGAVSTVGIKITSSWQAVGTGSNTTGVNTGNNSGIYPDVVISQAYWSSTLQQTFNLTGLDTARNRSYTLTFFGSRTGVTDNRTGNYTVNGQTVSLNATGNYQNTVSLRGLKPAADGTLAVAIKNGTGSSYVYLNALVIQAVYNDSTAPAAPQNLVVTMDSLGNSANLSWNAPAYNDTAYLIYRSTDSVTFGLLARTTAHATSYRDSSITGNTVYYYKISAVNAYGVSSYAGPVRLSVPNKAPVITPVPDLTMKGDTSLTVNISASYTPGDSIRLSVQNLPSFGSFTDLGNGKGRLVFAPANGQVGVYNNIIVTATDDHGGVGNDTLRLTVRDRMLTATYINFNQTGPQGSPWNNFNLAPVAGAAVTNALDENGVASGITTTLTEAWSGAGAVGATTGNNSGVYPDNVMQTSYYDNSGSARHIRLTGLKATNKYNLIFFASRIATDTRITYFSVGADTVSLNVSGNMGTTVQLNGKVPDSSGAITISISKASAAPYAYINAMVIQSYVSTGTPLDPANLSAQAISRTAVKLSWSDRSDNETAFEIWRAPVPIGSLSGGQMTRIDTVAANITSYTDRTVSSTTNYIYQVRARNGALLSGYSNPAYCATIRYQVFVNFNRDNPAAAPWNNTNSAPEQDVVYPNLVDDSAQASGMNMTIASNFSGDNPYGVNTGNNSGIYPDNVIDKTWWTDAGTTATLKIDGLNQAMTYNFIFFASRTATDAKDRTTVYAIGGHTATLNATNNSTQTTQLNGMVPDSTGAIYINISNAATSTYGYIGAMVIQAANPFNTPVVLAGIDSAAPTGGSPSQPPADSVYTTKLMAYPNPFTDAIQVNLVLERAVDKLEVRMVDISGRQVYSQQFSGLPVGTSNLRLGINGGQLRTGLYFVQVVGLPGGGVRILKLMKR